MLHLTFQHHFLVQVGVQTASIPGLPGSLAGTHTALRVAESRPPRAARGKLARAQQRCSPDSSHSIENRDGSVKHYDFFPFHSFLCS